MLYTPAFWALFAANLTTVASFAAFFLFPLFITEHGGGEAEIGLVMGVFALASTLSRPWVAELIDRFGRKKSYCLGALFMAALPLAYLPFLNGISYAPLLLLRAAHGVALAICFTAVFTYVADLIPPERLNEGIGIFGISGLTGFAIGPLLAEGVLRRFGFPSFFLLSAALAGLAFFLVLPLREKEPAGKIRSRHSFFALLRQRKFLVVAGLSLLFGFGLAATGNFVAPLAEERGIPVISIFFLAYSAGAIGIRLIGGRLTDRIGESRMLPYALVVSAAGILTLTLVTGGFTLALAGLLAGGGHGLLFPVLNTLAVRGEPFEVRGKATGIFTGAIDAGNFLGSFILGVVGDLAGLSPLFAVAGGALLLGLAVARFRPTG
ncbi:MFS transporter [Desulfuromonas sp. TF]|uniref:MFS transporter n=1 Tax=Desulfuromonas sp. TF TaxID=1232410 RepID=UPI0004218AAF|nr:MFS transporter [Desulfuromonas sp. TF]